MKIFDSIRKMTETAKQKHFVLLVSLVYNFPWSVCKILFGAFTQSYFFCISGASTLLFGFVKKIYLKNYNSNDVSEKVGKSITISILLIISSALFTFYMARLFFVNDVKDYDKILSITIATFSFFELGYATYHFVKAQKTSDVLLKTFKGCSLVSSLYAIVLTQVALLSATKTNAQFFNGLTGVILGSFAILIGVYLLLHSCKMNKLTATKK